MAGVTTLPPMWWPLMDAPDVITPYCAVCGRTGHIERHHMVKRSAGRLYRDGFEVPKSLITLCGHGNADGCHGKAHSGRLHFRWSEGALWYLMPPEPCGYLEAQDMDGWRRVRCPA